MKEFKLLDCFEDNIKEIKLDILEIKNKIKELFLASKKV